MRIEGQVPCFIRVTAFNQQLASQSTSLCTLTLSNKYSATSFQTTTQHPRDYYLQDYSFHFRSYHQQGSESASLPQHLLR